MEPVDVLKLLEKVGAAAMMNLPEVLVPGVESILELLSDESFLGDYFASANAKVFNIYAVQRGLFELSEQYFRTRSVKAIISEAVHLLHGFSRKTPFALPLVKKPPPTGASARPVVVEDVGVVEVEPHEELAGAAAPQSIPEATVIPVASDNQNEAPIERRDSDPNVPDAPDAVLLSNPEMTVGDWLRQRDIAFDAVDELRRLVADPAEGNDIELIGDQVPIEMSDRELNIQRIQVEDMFPMPLDIGIDDGFGEEPIPVLQTGGAPVETMDLPVEAEVEHPAVRRKPRRNRNLRNFDPSYRPPTLRRPPSAERVELAMAEISDIRRNLALINSQNTPNEPETTATVTEMMDHFNAPTNQHQADLEPMPVTSPHEEFPQIVPVDDFGSDPMVAFDGPQTVDLENPESGLAQNGLSVVAGQMPSIPEIIEPVLDANRSSIPRKILSIPDHIVTTFEDSSRLSIPHQMITLEHSTPVDKSAGRQKRFTHGAVALSPVLEIVNELDDRQSIERAQAMPDMDHQTPCVHRTPNITPAVPRPPYVVELPKDAPNLLIKPVYGDQIGQLSKVASYMHASMQLIDGRAPLDAKSLLRSATPSTSRQPYDTSTADAFVAYCHLHNKQYLTMETVATPRGSVFAAVTPKRVPDTADSE